MGVVAAVEALQGLLEEVNCVDGLLIELIEDEAGLEGRLLLAANACSSGINRGGKPVDPYVAGLPGIATPRTVSSSRSMGDEV